MKDKKSGSDRSAATAAPKKPKRSVISTQSSGDTTDDVATAQSAATNAQPKVEPVTAPAVTESVFDVAPPAPLTVSTAVEHGPTTEATPLASTLLSAVGFAPSADGDSPDAPGDSPLTLLGLAAFRRQTQQALTEDETAQPMSMAAALTTNSAPTLPTQPTGIPDPVTGVVKGAVVASDGDGNTLTYSASATSANGGKVTINSTTGAYTYTPTTAARVAAGTTAGADTDTFTVSVSDGQANTTATVPVYVSPLQLGSLGATSVGDQPTSVAIYENPTDPTKNRMYVTNQYAKTVSVIDATPGSGTYNQVVGTIKLASTPSDIVINSTGTRAYVTMKGSASVAVINTVTNKVIDVNPGTTTVDSIKVGSTPAGIAISPDDSRVYVTNGGGSTVSVIDTALNKEISRITVGSQPSGITVSPDGKKLYVTLRYSDSLAVVDLANNNAKTTVQVGDSPRDVALNPTWTRAYVTNYDGTVSVVNTTTNKVIATITTGGPKYQSAGVAVSATDGLAYVVNGNDSLSLIDTKTNTLVRTIVYESGTAGAHAIALSATGRIYVTDFQDDKLRTFIFGRGNTAPVAIANPTVGSPNPANGAVTGLINMKDPDGDGLSFTTVSGPTNGSVSYDPVAGTYTYTPTASARTAAGQGTGPTSDTFTVRGTDGDDAFTEARVVVPISSLGTIPASVSSLNVTGPTTIGFGGNQLYAYNQSTGVVSMINPTTNQVTSVSTPWSEPPATSPSGDRKYVVKDTTISVINTATGVVIANIAVPDYNDGGYLRNDVVVSPDGSRVYVSEDFYNWDQPSTAVSVIDAVDNRYMYSVETPMLADLDITSDGTRLYGGDYHSASIYVFDRDMNQVGYVPLVQNPFGGAFWVNAVGLSADGKKAYALYYADPNAVGDYSQKVAVIDTDPTSATYNTVLAQVVVQTTAVSPDGSRRYTLQSDGKTVVVSNTSTNAAIGAFTTDQNSSAGARSIAVAPNGTLYIADAADNKVYIVTV
ncbi:beta-propeller fold lactonase family protein [Mycobacterium sp. OAE908]|uniref:beta-propeller fold lactonase family protein n=1 Tax=Mycobacterium sp. OAE908 TaxID=2817899 RepID=UPI001AE9A8BB